MPSGSNNASRKAANGSAVFKGAASGTRAVKRVSQGDENNVSSKRMKRGKRVMSSGAESSAESNNNMNTIAGGFGEEAQQLLNPKSKKRFVGVRQRPSGRWVAEIKDTTQKIRLWLGTFDSAEEGAKAYDSAARALRGANTRTNFVPGIASCEGTVPATTSKAARLIRLRQQTVAAANAKPKSREKLGRGPNQSISPLRRRDLNQQQSDKSWDAHGQVDVVAAASSPKPPARLIGCKPNALSEASQSEQAVAITSETLSNAIHHSLTAADPSPQDHSSRSNLPSAVDSCNGASTSGSSNDGSTEVQAATGHQQELPPLKQQSVPLAINRANAAASDREAASSADDNEVTMFNSVNTTSRPTTCQDDAESPLIQRMGTTNPLKSSDLDHMVDQLDHRNDPDVLRGKESYSFSDGAQDGAGVSDMIPWQHYVLMDGLDVLSCETSTTGVSYPAFEFSAEAMDRDSLEDLSDDSSEFLLRLQHCQGQCELPKSSSGGGTEQQLLPRPPDDSNNSPACTDSDGAGGHEQALMWSSLDLTPHCMVA